MTLTADDAPIESIASTDTAAPTDGNAAASADAGRTQKPAAPLGAARSRSVRSNAGLIWVSLVLAIALACMDSYIGSRDSDPSSLGEHPTIAFIKLQLRVAREVVYNDEQRLGKALWSLACFKDVQGETAAAQRLYEQALKTPISSLDRSLIESRLTAIYEESNNRKALPSLFIQAHHDDVFEKGLLGFQMVNVYDRGARIFEESGDKVTARRLREGAEKSRRVPSAEMGEPKVLNVFVMKTWQELGDTALCNGEHKKAREYYSELIDDKIATKHFQCRGRISLFVTSVDSGDFARAQTELAAARESAAWLKAHAKLGFRDEATFMSQYARLLEAQGKNADAKRYADKARVAYKVDDWSTPQPESFARTDEE